MAELFPPYSSPENKTEFLKKWDNGEGFDWRAGCGCGWNSSDNGEIYNKEIEYAGGYGQLIADFRALDPHDQKTVAGMFMYDVVDKFFDTTAHVDYKWFKLTFDPGDDNIFDKDDIVEGGGYMVFLEEVDKLAKTDEITRTVIMARLSKEVETELKDSGNDPVALFWKTYDNANGNRIISAYEIFNVNGGKRFVHALKSLPKEEAVKALDALEGVTNPTMLKEIKDSFPEYSDEYNLAQFPNLKYIEPYETVREGLEIIKKISGKSVSRIQNLSLPPLPYELPASWEEMFYAALYDKLGLFSAINIDEFVRLFNEYKNKIPTATISKLKHAIEKEGLTRYSEASFEINLRGVSRKEREDRVIRYVEDGDIELTSETGKFFKALRGLKDIRLEEEVTEDSTSHKERKFYTILVPVMASTYEFEVQDTRSAEGTNLPLWISHTYQKYDIDTSYMTITERKFNDNALSTFFFSGGNLTVKVSSVTGDVYLQPAERFVEQFLETEKIY